MSTTPTPEQTRAAQVAGLRELADLLEQHPELTPRYVNVSIHRLDTPAAVAAFVTDQTRINAHHDFATAVRTFGNVAVTAHSRLHLLTTGPVEIAPAPEVRTLTVDEIRVAAEASVDRAPEEQWNGEHEQDAVDRAADHLDREVA